MHTFASMLHMKIHSQVKKLRTILSFLMLFIFTATLAVQAFHRHGACNEHADHGLSMRAVKSCVICDYHLHKQAADSPEIPFVLTAPVIRPVTLLYSSLTALREQPRHTASSRGPPSCYC